MVPRSWNKQKIILGLWALGLAAPTFGADLMQVYQQALTSDAAFKVAQATWLAARENLPISKATLFPQLNLTGNALRTHGIGKGGATNTDVDYFTNTAIYGLSVTQQIFNFTNWMAIKNAGNTVKQAQATVNAAAQDLMLRTSKAYFAVLKAEDILRYTRAEKTAVWRELDQTQKKYNVGLIPITDVDNAKAKYDTVVSQEITAANDLDNQRENLRVITKTYYTDLSPLVTNLPLVTPNPVDIEAWVRTAEKQNYSLQATHFAALAAHDTIAMKRGGNYPVLNATGSYNYSNDGNSGGSGFGYQTKSTVGGLSLTFPIFQGGLVMGQTKQAEHQYEQAVANDDLTHNQTVSNTRQSYLGVMSGISKVQADAQVIISNESNLSATQAAYEAGTRTMVDVLNAEATLYESQKTHAADQYNYLVQTLTLKQLAGTLGPDDLQIINSWLQTGSKKTPQVGEITLKVKGKPHPETAVTVTAFYVVQLSASKNQAGLIKSLADYQAKHKDLCSYTPKGGNGVIICGHYTSPAEAKAAIVKLPKSLYSAKVKVVAMMKNAKTGANHANKKPNKINE